MKFTPEQELAITARGKNILVSASAGSGKTSVMIERIVRIILEGQAEINEILAMTFTKLAAEQIKAKLSKALKKACKIKSGLSAQLDKLSYANISTIHSFCNNMLKTYFYKVGLDAGFKIIEPIDEKELKTRAINRLFTALYEGDDQTLSLLLRKLISKRSDRVLREQVLTLYEYIVTEPDPQAYLDKSLQKYTEQGVSEISRKYLNDIKEDLKLFIAPLKQISEGFGEGDTGVYPMVEQMLEDINFALKVERFEDLSPLAKKTYHMTSKGYKDSEILMELKEKARAQKTLLEKVNGRIEAFITSLGNKEGYYKTAEDFKGLVQLVNGFTAEYKALKTEAGVVDYADLEQLVIELLKDDEVAEDISQKFKFIFVDEYQDVNPAQEYIIKRISKNNLFLVGDVKQAIYGFRGSDSELFVATENAYKNGEGIFIELNKNFRSASAVIEGVNKVFSTAMTISSGTGYAQRQMIYGDGYPDEGECKVYPYEKEKKEEVVWNVNEVYDLQKHALNSEQNSDGQEETLIAKIVADCVGKKYFDLTSGEYKTIGFKDIVILSRSLGEKMDCLAKRLSQLGIRVQVSNKSADTQYPEILMLTDILKLLVNFNSDTALVSAMLSPMGGFNQGELIEIKKNFKGSFVEAFFRYCKNDEIGEKIANFKELYSKLRLRAEIADAGEVIATLYNITPMEATLGAQMYGEEKLKRIYRFMELGKGYRVDDYLQRLSSGKISFNFESDSGDSVKIMSMHASKGLEFPVVILAGCGREYNDTDLKEILIFDRAEGVAFLYYDEKTKIKYPLNPFREYVKYRLKKRLIREEIRLFYVATTRAKYSLCVVGETKGLKEKIEPNELNFINRYIDYIKIGDMEISQTSTTLLEEKAEQKAVIIGEKNDKLAEKIHNNLTFSYAFEGKDIPLKSSVSGVCFGESKIYETTKDFGQTSAEKGTAYHKFLELWDFKENWLEFYKNSAKEKMCEDYNLLDEKVLEKICSMEVFSKLIGYTLHKEKQFIVGVPYNLVANSQVAEEVVIQGTIDLLAVKEDRAIIIDYKYSSISSDKDLLEKYTKQLALYAYAVQKVLKLPVEAHLVNIYSQKVISLDNESLKL